MERDEQQFRDDVRADAPDRAARWSWPSAAWAVQAPFRRFRRGTAVLVLATVALVGWSMLQQLDLGLSRMHVNGVPKYGTSALVGPSIQAPKPWAAAVDTWSTYRVQACRTEAQPGTQRPGSCPDTRAGASISPWEAVLSHLIVDTLLFAFPAAFLLWFLVWRCWRRARRSASVSGALQQVLALGLVVPMLVLVLDLLENAGIGVVLLTWDDGVARWLAWTLTVLTLAKWGAVLVVAVVLVVVTVRMAADPTSGLSRDVRHAFRRAVALRAQLFAAMSVLLLLLLSMFAVDLGNQILDVIVRWIQHPGVGVVTFVLLALLTATVVGTAAFSLRDHDAFTARPRRPLQARTVGVLIGVGLALVVVGAVVNAQRWWLLPIGAALVLFGLLSLPKGVRAATAIAAPTRADGGGWVLVFLATVPGWVVAVLLTRVVVTLAFQGAAVAYRFWFTVLCGVAAAMGLGAGLLVRRLDLRARHDPAVATGSTLARVAAAVVVVALVAAWVVGIADPLPFGRAVGAIGAILLFGTGVCWLLVGVTALSNRWPAKGALAVLQFQRVPVLTIVVVLAVIGGLLDRDYRTHDVRLLAAGSGAEPQPLLLDDAWQAWGDTIPASGDVPMVFVASTGGGIRAAYWTAITMGCLLGIDPPSRPTKSRALCSDQPAVDEQRVFLASGVSGGSLGLVATFAGGTDDTADRLRGDFVSPTIARLLLLDAPNALLRLDDVDDRAVVLEHAWEEAWDDVPGANPLREGLFEWQREHLGEKPVLLLNGATVQDACRMAATALRTSTPLHPRERPSPDLVLSDRSCTTIAPLVDGSASPAAPASGDASAGDDAELAQLEDALDPSLVRTTSLYDLSCGPTGSTHHDVALSTAALLSARFPVVSPSGGLYRCPVDGAGGGANERLSDVDGGLIETSGAKPLDEVFARIAPLVRAANEGRVGCIRPRLVLLDNQYVSSARPGTGGRTLESLLLLKEKGVAAKGLTGAARQEAALAFDAYFAGVCDGSQPASGSGGSSDAGGSASGPADASTTACASKSVAYLFPVEHPGVRAPLGWTLSQVSADDMDEQLTGSANATQLARIRSWFDPSSTTC